MAKIERPAIVKSKSKLFKMTYGQFKAVMGIHYRDARKSIRKDPKGGHDYISFSVRIDFHCGKDSETVEKEYSNVKRKFYGKIFTSDVINKIDHAKDRHAKTIDSDLVMLVDVDIRLESDSLDSEK